MTLFIVTGSWYPVRPLNYEVKHTSLPRVVVDQCIHEINGTPNTCKRWGERESSISGCFGLEMGALHFAVKTNDHVNE